jgi:hypothetical protein
VFFNSVYAPYSIQRPKARRSGFGSSLA